MKYSTKKCFVKNLPATMCFPFIYFKFNSTFVGVENSPRKSLGEKFLLIFCVNSLEI